MLVLGHPLPPVVDGKQHDTPEAGDDRERDLEQVQHLRDVEGAGLRKPRPPEEPQQPDGGGADDHHGQDEPAEHRRGHPPPPPRHVFRLDDVVAGPGGATLPAPAVCDDDHRHEQQDRYQEIAQPVGHEG
ncbi:hypothetical protein [Amycolatopsis tolypomycina]|uniref:hypothetical protein n=1 Tax=Amycolatopsis tolypomycina TaxID=208445 RepID=UPI0033BA556A